MGSIISRTSRIMSGSIPVVKSTKYASCRSEIMNPQTGYLNLFLATLRPNQWTKNLIVFAAPLFAFSISWQSFLSSLLAFTVFCLTSSSFYIVNDIADIKSDRLHPVKCKRPIAAGLVRIRNAIAWGTILILTAFIISWRYSSALGEIITGYTIMQIAYNLRLKHIVILDIMTISFGFILRACAGGVATHITLSPWFILCTAMLALFLSVEKRKSELRMLQLKGAKTRSVLQQYSIPFLERIENAVTASTIITYSLWSSGPVVRGASTPWMMLTLPFVLYGIFRYQFLSDPQEIARKSSIGFEVGQTERPEEVLLKDVPILVTVIGWILTIFIILLLKQQSLIE